MSRYFLFPVLCSCFLLSAQCQPTDVRGVIKGEGNNVKQEVSIGPIKGVDLGFAGQVILTQGSPQHIEMEGQKNILDIIHREVKDGVWKIYYEKNVKEANPVVVRITVPHLDQVSVSGSGSITTTNQFTGVDDIEISISGSGSVSMNYAALTSDANISGSGKINLSGSSKELAVSISGSGDVMAENLQVDNCEVHISGSGDAVVNVNQQLDTHISGSGDVRYKGTASVETHVNGSGGVTKMN